MPQRIDAGPALAGAGGALLLVSLFLPWFGGASAWTSFELIDLGLAVLAVLVLAVCTGAEVVTARIGTGRLPLLAGVAVLVVLSQIIQPPPVAVGAPRDLGAWLGLVAVAAMVAGAVLSVAEVTVSLAPRPPSDARATAAAPAAGSRPAEGGRNASEAATVAGPAADQRDRQTSQATQAFEALAPSDRPDHDPGT